MIKKYEIISLLAIFEVIVMAACTPTNKSNGRLLRTDTLDKGLCLECYEMSRGGVFSGNTYGYFLIDSGSFSYFVGFGGDNDVLCYQLGNDTVFFWFESDEEVKMHRKSIKLHR